MGLDELASKLAAINQNRPDPGIFLRADETVPYGYVMQVMGLIRQAGIKKIGMVTESEKSRAGLPGEKAKDGTDLPSHPAAA